MARIVGMKGKGGMAGGVSMQKKGTTYRAKQTMSLEFIVIGDGPGDTPASVMRSAGLPQIGGKAYGLVVMDVDAQREAYWVNGQDFGKWAVSMQLEAVEGVEGDELEPTELPPEVSWDSEEYEEVLRQDINDPSKKVKTKCGEPLTLTTRRVIEVLTIKRTENAPFAASKIHEFTNTVNSGQFWGAPAGSALLAKIGATYKQVETTRAGKKWFVDVTYVIKFKFDPETTEPWQARVLHWGTKAFVDGTHEAQAVRDGSGNVSGCLLDASGFKLADTAEPVYLKSDAYKKKDFSALGIDEGSINSAWV